MKRWKDAVSRFTRLASWLFARRVYVAAVVALAAVLVVELAEARPGGGNTYRGSGRSSGGGSRSGGGGSGGGGDGGDLFIVAYYLIRLAIEVPAIGVPLLCIGALFLFFRAREGFRGKAWTSAPADFGHAPAPPRGGARRRLEELRRTDEGFSLVLFEDFLQALYAELHAHRGAGRLDRIAPYVSEAARRELSALGTDPVFAVVVGAMRFVSATEAPPGPDGRPQLAVTVEVESNYSERGAGGDRTFYARDRLVLHRSIAARSRAPGRTRSFECPNCGAPLDQMQGRTCGYCQKTVDTGEFDWVVTSFRQVERESRPPALAGDAPEVGTDEPTRVDPEAGPRWEALVARDPALGWSGFVARVDLVFRELQVAWTAQDMARARPFVTDPLLQSWAYWFEAYRRQGLRNMAENPRIATVHLARVTTDRVYDAVTVRVFASSMDFTVDAAGKIVAGSRSRARDYSEYWTLIRGTGRTGAPRGDAVCPNCGAPLAVEMTGQCTYCKAKVTTGEFDWVLSRIEQDESYGD